MSIQWPLVIFTLLTGTGAGTMVFIGLAELLNVGAKARKLAGWVAAILVVAGGIASVLHLGSPGNVMAALGNLGSFSGISIELMLLAVSSVVSVVYAVVANEEGSKAAKGVGVVALIVGLFFVWALGSSYMIASRPAWASLALPFAYLGSGLALGGFLYFTLLVIKKDVDGLRKVAVFVLIATIVEIAGFLTFGIMAGELALVDNALLFWAGAIAAGVVVPLIAAVMRWRNTKWTVMAYVGLIGVVAGGLAFRTLMWAVGNPAIFNLFDVAANSRGYYPF
jgi:anaerobic dimethyl sulfoxide reductase subunit C (anchor subunit)